MYEHFYPQVSVSTRPVLLAFVFIQLCSKMDQDLICLKTSH